MKKQSEESYLDLLKKTLTFSLWPEPPKPIDNELSGMNVFKRCLLSAFNRYLEKMNMHIVEESSVTEEERMVGKLWPGYADTMIGLERLNNLHDSIQIVLNEGVEGDFIECGVWRGGVCIFMRAALVAYGIEDRKVLVADSFEGLPKPDPEKYPQDKHDNLHTFSELAISIEQVRNNFQKYGLLDEKVVFLKGWFEDTLPNAPIEKLAILRLDGDMYGSTMTTLSNLYPKLSIGGICIVDDYALPTCKKAVDDYREKHGIQTAIKKVDWTGRYWRKE